MPFWSMRYPIHTLSDPFVVNRAEVPINLYRDKVIILKIILKLKVPILDIELKCSRLMFLPAKITTFETD